MVNQRNEDMCDYPLSPTWISYYADQGMTPDYPEAYYYKLPERQEPQWDEPDWVKRQVGIIHQLQGKINFLQNKINEHLDRKSPKSNKPIRPIDEIGEKQKDDRD